MQVIGGGVEIARQSIILRQNRSTDRVAVESLEADGTAAGRLEDRARKGLSMIVLTCGNQCLTVALKPSFLQYTFCSILSILSITDHKKPVLCYINRNGRFLPGRTF